MAVGNPQLERIGRYNRTAIALHWVVATFVTINIVLGLAGANIGNEQEARHFVDAHKSVGLTIFGLMVLRLLWRWAHKPPPFPRAYGRFDRLAAHMAHGALYAVLLLLPLTGYIHDSAWKLAASHPVSFFGVFPIPRIALVQALDPKVRERIHDIFGASHLVIGYILYGLLALHLLGVAKHHAVDHEAELQRMWPAAGSSPRDPAD